MELARGVRSQLEGLIAGLAGTDLTPMSLGLSHSLSRYKLKFSPDKVGSAPPVDAWPPDYAQPLPMAPCVSQLRARDDCTNGCSVLQRWRLLS